MKFQLVIAALVQKWNLSYQLRFQFKNEFSVDNYNFSSKTKALVGGNRGFSSKIKSHNYNFNLKMKYQLSIEVLTKIMKKYIYIFITWLLRDTKDINLNVSFIKWLHPIFFLINGSFWPKTQDGKHTVGCPAALQSMKGIRTFPINSEKEKITNFLSSTIFSCVITYTQICQSSPRPQVLRRLRLKSLVLKKHLRRKGKEAFAFSHFLEISGHGFYLLSSNVPTLDRYWTVQTGQTGQGIYFVHFRRWIA